MSSNTFSAKDKILTKVLQQQKGYKAKKYVKKISQQKLVSVVFEWPVEEDWSNWHCQSQTWQWI